MQELGYIVFFLAYWFVIPYLLGTLFFKRLAKKWRWLVSGKKMVRVAAYVVFLLCALVGWLIEMLVLTGVKMML
jgi:hypothetical protein